VKEEVTVTLSPANKKAIDTLKPVVISTRGREELAAEAYEIVAAEGIKAICLIPLVNRGRVLGTLSISRTTETPFVPEDIDFLSRASGRSPSPLKTRWHTEKFPTQGQAGPGETLPGRGISQRDGFEQIIGNSKTLKHVLQQVKTVAPSDSTVLLLGETGTERS